MEFCSNASINLFQALEAYKNYLNDVMHLHQSHSFDRLIIKGYEYVSWSDSFGICR